MSQLTQTMSKKNVELHFYTEQEENLNFISHLIGIVLSIIASGFMLYFVIARSEYSYIAPITIYLLSLITLYVISTTYHNTKTKEGLLIMRKADHISISPLIAGTATPIFLISVGGALGISFTCIIWVLCAINIVLNIINLNKYSKISLALYLIMGWLVVFIIKDIIINAGWVSFGLLLGGGVSFTIGVYFFKKKTEYMHFIWHIFVLVGTMLHYFSILFGIVLK